MFLLLALAMPFFLYGEEPSISPLSTPSIPTELADTTGEIGLTDSADVINSADTIGSTLTLPDDILEGLIAHLQEINPSSHTPFRKASSIVTHLDSSIVVDQNGIPTKKIIYDYDELERIYRTTTYFYTNGIPNNWCSISELLYNGSSSSTLISSSYKWNQASSEWNGISRIETVYNDANQRITTITYTWDTYKFWTPTKSTTYQVAKYNNTWKIEEQLEYAIDNATHKLSPVKRTHQEWDNLGRNTLNEVYTAYSGSAWTHANNDTKNIYEYLGNTSNKTLTENYWWSASTHDWYGKNGQKTATTYNDKNKTTKVVTFNWNTSILQYDTAKVVYTFYEPDGTTVNASYTYVYNNGVISGSGNYTRTVYTGSNKDSVLTYVWDNNTSSWINTRIVVSLKDAFAAKITVSETLTFNRTTNLWSGSGSYYAYDSNKNQIYYTYYTQANSELIATPTPRDSTAYIYSGTTKMQETKYSWNGTEWVPSKRITYINGSASNTITQTYTNGAWIVSSGYRRVTLTDTEGASLTLIYQCNPDSSWYLAQGDKTRTFIDSNGASVTLNWTLSNTTDSVWLLNSGNKTPANIKDANGRTTCSSSYYCSSDSAWKVATYETWQYDEFGNTTFHFQATKDSVPVFYQLDSYNTNNRVVLTERYNWNATDGTYRGKHRYEYTYAADNVTQIGRTNYYNYNTTCGWDGYTNGGSSYLISLDELGRTLTNTQYLWNSTSCSWDNFVQNIYTYDASGNVIVNIILHGPGYSDYNSALDTDNDNWVYYSKTEMEYIGSHVNKQTDYYWSGSEWIPSRLDETTYVAGTSNVKTTTSITYNTDGTIATYEKTTNYYNTEE